MRVRRILESWGDSVITTYEIYLLIGFLSLGLIDLYLHRYPLFHPIVILPVVGWFWGDLDTGLIIGALLELIFGIAQLRETRRLNLVLYAGGLAIFLNQQTHNINLTLCLSMGLLIALVLQLMITSVRDWLKWLLLVAFSLVVVFLLPWSGEIFGLIPASVLQQISVAGSIVPWIFFAYAIWNLQQTNRQREVILLIPAIIIGALITLRLFFWGPVVFLGIYYLLDTVLKGKEVKVFYWLDWLLLIVGIYLFLPELSWTTFSIFAGILALNILLVARKFAPLEIYSIMLVSGIILHQGGLLH